MGIYISSKKVQTAVALIVRLKPVTPWSAIVFSRFVCMPAKIKDIRLSFQKIFETAHPCWGVTRYYVFKGVHPKRVRQRTENKIGK